MEQPKLVLPGDQVAVAEEFEAGEGTYERDGQILASMPGVLWLDHANRIAKVRAFNPPAALKVGDVVYGVVDDIRQMMATATVGAVHGRTRQISGEAEGTIHISNVSEAYTEDIRDMFRLGDIIRAKVIQVKPSLQLTTAEPILGVVRAMCSQCRGPLEVRERDLFCLHCERTERRKITQDYGDLRLSAPASELGAGVVAERQRRGGRGGRGRGRGGRGGGGGGRRDDRRGHGRPGGRDRRGGRDRDRGDRGDRGPRRH